MQEYPSAINALLKVIGKGRSLDVSFHTSDSPLSKQIAYGVLRHYYELDNIIKSLLNKPLGKKHLDLQLLLLSGIYSIDHLKRPNHTSVNAVVDAALALNKPWAKGLVNGVLRQYIRQKDKANALDTVAESFSNHPEWLELRVIRAYPEVANKIFEANNTQAPMTLRVNLLKNTRNEYQKMLGEHKIESSQGSLSPTSLTLKAPSSIDSLPNFQEGFASVQDQASQLIPPLLNLTSGLRVLDACSAPGGKTCHILESCEGLNLVALDIDESRLNLVRENLTRLGLACELKASNLMDYEPSIKFDRILLDAPCSATGIIRRHPDIKLLRRDEDIDRLALTQLELLVKAWSLLKEDGELVYSTCSILPTENEEVINAFLASESTALPQTINVSWGQAAGTGRLLLPSNSNLSANTDGFYFARLKKTSL